MFHKPSEPKPGSPEPRSRQRPASPAAAPTTPTATSATSTAAAAAAAATKIEAATAPVAGSSSSAASLSAAKKLAQLQRVPTATASTSNGTTTANASSRLDGELFRSRQQQQQSGKPAHSVAGRQQVAASALHQHYLNYFNSNIPREETKSQRARGSISESLAQHSSRQQQQQGVFPSQEILQAQQQQLLLSDHPNAPPSSNQKSNTSHSHISHIHHQSHHHNHNHQHHAQQHTNHNHHAHGQHNDSSAQIYHVPSLSRPPSHGQQQQQQPAPGDQHNNQHLYASALHVSRSVPREEAFASHRMTAAQSHNQTQAQQMNPTLNHRTYSTGAIATSQKQQQQQQQFQPHSMNQGRHRELGATAKALTRSTRQSQLDRDSDDRAAAIKGELEQDLEGYKNSELEAISSLERNLPIELSFLIRQQAHCVARMNYLDRQLRELRENTAYHLQQQQQQQQQLQQQQKHQQHLNYHHHQPQQQQFDVNQVTSSTSFMNGQVHPNARYAAPSVGLAPTSVAVAAGATSSTALAHGKNGNFILSDDSGGEYSRATISDDDELSSLLDQIAKSVRPADAAQRPLSNADLMLNGQMQHMQQQQHQRVAANYSTFVGQPPPPPLQQQQHNLHYLQHAHSHHHQQQQQQSYAILNRGHQAQPQQAVPIFVMSSPIAVAHPSSISSNILPGVHFQPEPRYNQYYEDFYGAGGQLLAPLSGGSLATAPLAPPATMQRSSGPALASGGPFRAQHFDTSMSAVEQLVSQKEKRQIISQLKSADNWLKMRAANNDLESAAGAARALAKQAPAATSAAPHAPRGDEPVGTSSDRSAASVAASGDPRASSSSTVIKQESNDRVIDETVDA